MPPPLLDLYEARVAEGLVRDDAQFAIVERLDALRGELQDRPSGWSFRKAPPAPRGLYLWGDVGRGKSMLVDLLAADPGRAEIRRTHLHAFMRDIHAALHEARTSGADAPLRQATDTVAGGIALLILDEVEVTDIADAMIVGRVFEQLFATGTALVATSNCAPDALYQDGLKREHFEPFVQLIETHCAVVHLGGDHDYRDDAADTDGLWLSPADKAARARLDALWTDLGPERDRLAIGRGIRLDRRGDGVRAPFDTLCRNPLTAGDFLSLAEEVRIVLLDDVPVLGERDDDAARRFMLLIDTLYDAGCGLAATAVAPIGKILAEGTFEAGFRRTASRLTEMTGRRAS